MDRHDTEDARRRQELFWQLDRLAKEIDDRRAQRWRFASTAVGGQFAVLYALVLRGGAPTTLSRCLASVAICGIALLWFLVDRAGSHSVSVKSKRIVRVQRRIGGAFDDMLDDETDAEDGSRIRDATSWRPHPRMVVAAIAISTLAAIVSTWGIRAPDVPLSVTRSEPSATRP